MNMKFLVVIAACTVGSLAAMEPVDDDVATASKCYCLALCVKNQTVPAAAEPTRALTQERQKQITNMVWKQEVTKDLFKGVIRRNHIKVVNALKEGADPNALDGIGWAPLHYAARDMNVEVGRILLAVQGIDSSMQNGSKQTAAQMLESRQLGATRDHAAHCREFLRLLQLHATNQYPFVFDKGQLIPVKTTTTDAVSKVDLGSAIEN